MLIIMGGFPGSGKSTFVAELYSIISPIDPIVVDPKILYYSDEWKALSSGERSQVAIAAWSKSKEDTIEYLGAQLPDRVIILDSSGSNYMQIYPIIEAAHKHNHKVLYIFVSANIENCQSRLDERLADDIVERYTHNFTGCISKIRTICDDMMLITNNSKISDLRKQCKNAALKLLRRHLEEKMQHVI